MGDTHNELHGDVHGVLYQARTINVFGEHAVPALMGLPRPEPAFTGRATELARLAAALRGGDQAVVVSGLGGVGKSTLVIRAAHDALEQFPGGVLFLNLHGYSPEGRVEPADALATLLRDLGTPQIPPTPAGRETLYRSVLAKRTEPILIVLDNASSSEQVRPLLPGVARHRVLVTSRHTLGDLGAVHIDLNVLGDDDATVLIDTVLGADGRVRAEPEAAATLGRLCGYLPLAVRIAASILADDVAMPISELVDALRGEATRLKELVYGEDLAVRNAFDLSFRRLTATQQRMFALLGLHPGAQIGFRCAAALAEVSEREARRTLDELRRAHMILVGEPRGWFRFHDLVRLHAVDESGALPDRDAAIRRMLRHYARTGLAANSWVLYNDRRYDGFDSLREALDWFEAELPSLRAVVTLTHDAGYHDLTREIAFGFTTIWANHGHTEDFVEVQRMALAATRALGDSQRVPVTLRNIGRSLLAMGDVAGADAALTEASYLVAALPYGAERSSIDTHLALVRDRQDRCDEAIELLNRALTTDDHYIGMLPAIYASLSIVHRHRGDPVAALHFRQQATDVYDGPKESIDFASHLADLADAHAGTGDVQKAVEVLGDALAVMRNIGFLPGQRDVLWRLAGYHATLKQYDLQLRYLRARAGSFTDGDRSAQRAEAVLELGKCLYRNRIYDEAVEVLRLSAELHAHLRVVIGEAHSQDWLSYACRDVEDLASAEVAARRALELYRQAGRDDDAAHVTRGLGNLRQDVAELEIALDHFRTKGLRLEEADTLRDIARVLSDRPARIRTLSAAVEILRDLGEPARLANALNALSNAHANDEDHAGAEATAREAVALARELGLADEEALACLRLGRALVKKGDHAGAIESLGRALAHGTEDVSDIHYHLGVAHRERGDLDRAREHLTTALDLDRRDGMPRSEGLSLCELGKLSQAAGDLTEARRLGARSIEVLTAAGETTAADNTRTWLDSLS
ncbi:hypothetical protein Lesp02_36540 [Lentzea sp. NBRC 105346]|uniref:tetratricopeptide repeat protein n=1 Tax=Lentzea sp. NBRC 105346 TaxID=3032205 RepID=UPI0024A00785|nr:tetratricopeptide repeat protein [Lentzea sp. NBRC 105346]GLZ31466.1 hypothetical protein Lesp02_36540 [Lentzea sp. NBRC 105346]